MMNELHAVAVKGAAKGAAKAQVKPLKRKRKTKADKAKSAVMELNRVIWKNHAQRVHAMIASLLPGKIAFKWKPNKAAERGHLHILHILRARNIHCTRYGPDFAIEGGHLHVIQDLRKHGIYCSINGAHRAAAFGQLEILRDLRQHGIHCGEHTANVAAGRGHLDIVRDLREHGIHCDTFGARRAATCGHLDVLRDLRAHGIDCPEYGMHDSVSSGHLHVLQDLHMHYGYAYLPKYITTAAHTGQLHIIKFLCDEMGSHYSTLKNLWDVNWHHGQGNISDYIGDYMDKINSGDEKSAWDTLKRAQHAAMYYFNLAVNRNKLRIKFVY